MWEHSAEEREDALAAMETIVAGTAREDELQELARQHVIERSVDRALFWAQPWSTKLDALSALRVREALAERRGVLLSACHVGPFYRLQCARTFDDRVTYLVPGPWFFEQPKPGYWGRRLARWHKGMKSRPVPARGSFRLDPGTARTGRGRVPGPSTCRVRERPASWASGRRWRKATPSWRFGPTRSSCRCVHGVSATACGWMSQRRWTRETDGRGELHNALAAVHERWILEYPAAMKDPRRSGWEEGASPQAWVAPARPTPT